MQPQMENSICRFTPVFDVTLRCRLVQTTADTLRRFTGGACVQTCASEDDTSTSVSTLRRMHLINVNLLCNDSNDLFVTRNGEQCATPRSCRFMACTRCYYTHAQRHGTPTYALLCSSAHNSSVCSYEYYYAYCVTRA